ncbi:MAG: hypothetical protein EOS56_14345 [Mesorhizobium sp.]|nr:MAG: hypothetical protein EOS29_21905 [Mesorhizobium sp.]RWC60466.1 MAG: hypothetical protein EOS56_14345 [Mesorhizobium sp.]
MTPKPGFDPDYFTFKGEMELLTSTPSRNIHDALASFGPADFLMKQSIVPVVAWREGENFIRCIGTASIVSCSGYVMTAAHILMDPFESGYGATRQGNRMVLADTLNFGVFVSYSPAYGTRGFRYFGFHKFWLWGHWKESPLIYEKDGFEYLTDVAICKIAEMPHGAAHQPLNLSLNQFVPGEAAYSLGYAEMADVPMEYGKDGMLIQEFEMDLFVSVGEVMRVFPENHLQKDVPAPGPSFDFKAKIPGKMSGAPIFGAHGAVIRGVVSRSFSGERHAFGAMLGPAMGLPLDEPQITGRTLRTLMETGNEGMARVQGAGL